MALGNLTERELLLRIDAKLETLTQSLYGGSLGGGDIPSLNALLNSHDKRLTGLEKWRWQITGAVVAGMSLAGASGGAIGSWLYRITQ